MSAVVRATVFLAGLAVVLISSVTAQSLPAQPQNGFGGAASALYLKVQLDHSVKVRTLRPGDVIEGRLSQDVYSGEDQLFPAGSRAKLIVDQLATQRRVPNDHWPWMIKFFGPRHEKYPTFRSASVLAAGKETPLQVSLVSISREHEVEARAKRSKSAEVPTGQPTGEGTTPDTAARTGEAAKKASGPIVTLEAAMFTAEGKPAFMGLAGPVTLAAGTQAKVVLLGGVSASKSRAGDSVQAQIVEPVRLDSKVVLPEGTLLQGKVVRSRPPRTLSRSGSLLLTFTSLTLPGGMDTPVRASITGTEIDERSHTAIDPEGTLHGERPGKAWMLLNAGVTSGIAKVADDGSQLVIEAIVSTATDASTAGTARIVAACASGIFMLTRHGRDVVMPKFTQMEITFDRPVSLGGPQTTPTAK